MAWCSVKAQGQLNFYFSYLIKCKYLEDHDLIYESRKVAINSALGWKDALNAELTCSE
jgi:hypothetical protein